MDLKTILPSELLKLCKKTKQPTFIKPMLATLTKDYFSSDEWIYEHKFDGERCIALKKEGKVILKSRNNRIINDEYPELVKALRAQKADNFIIDGEIVALNKKGLSDFQLLQSRINLQDLEDIKSKVKTTPIYYRIFDLMYINGYDVTHLPLLIRKALLKELLKYTNMLTYTEHKTGNGLAYFKYACAHRWEGLIAKKADSIYMEKRAQTWLKFKCSIGQKLP